MSSNLTEAAFAFIMALVFARIGWRAAIGERNRLALKPSEVAGSALSIYLGFFAAIFMTIMGLRILT
jgi:hypothetical protein